jgi:DNA-binding XRE family transcriptional regulator
MAVATRNTVQAPRPAAKRNPVVALRGRLGITQKVMARLLSVTERTLNTLEGGGKVSEPVSRRITELERLQKELSAVVKPKAIGDWLTKPNDAFDGHNPADLIASGKTDLLWQMIFMLRSGVSS